MKNVPEKIYLQVDADGETPEDFKGLEVSWCTDKIYQNDIEYILLGERKFSLKEMIQILDDKQGNCPCDICKERIRKYFKDKFGIEI